MSDGEGAASGPGLRCLGGQGAPPALVLGLKDLLLLPPSAKQHYWEALGPTLQQPLPDDLDQVLAAFQRQHEAPQGRLARSLEACRALFHEAGRHDVDAEQFEADLALVSNDAEQLAKILLPGFDEAMAVVKRAILHGTLLDHGNLLIDVTWRVDSMLHSHRGRELYSPVTLVTLRYLEGKQEHRITLQALPDLLERLRSMCNAILE